MKDRPRPLSEHLHELRNRLAVFLAVWLAVSTFAFFQVRKVIEWMLLPADGRIHQLVVMGPSEGLYTFLELALALGFVATSPVLISELAAFVAPALTPGLRRQLIGYVPTVFLLFLTGISFGYFMFLPVVLHFLLGFASQPFYPLMTISKYVGFILNVTLPFGLVFELPVVAFALSSVGVLDPAFLRHHRRTAILLIVVVAAAVTPPDALSMMIMVVPMLVLFEVSILVSALAARRYRRAVQYGI